MIGEKYRSEFGDTENAGIRRIGSTTTERGEDKFGKLGQRVLSPLEVVAGEVEGWGSNKPE